MLGFVVLAVSLTGRRSRVSVSGVTLNRKKANPRVIPLRTVRRGSAPVSASRSTCERDTQSRLEIACTSIVCRYDTRAAG